MPPNIKCISPSILKAMELCPACHGTGVDGKEGTVQPSEKCKACGGVGWVRKKPVAAYH